MRSVSRRSMFSLAAGLLAIFTARAKASAPLITKPGFPARGSLMPHSVLDIVDGKIVRDTLHRDWDGHEWSPPFVTRISTGNSLVPVDSPEGRDVLISMGRIPADGHPCGTFAKRYTTEKATRLNSLAGALPDSVHADLVSDGIEFVPIESWKGQAALGHPDEGKSSALLVEAMQSASSIFLM